MTEDYKGKVVFRHDARLNWPNLMYFSKDQVLRLYKDVQCPTYLILAEDGFLNEDEFLGENEKKFEDIINNYMRPTKYAKLPGSHHFHIDPDTADAVVETVIEFLKID